MVSYYELAGGVKVHVTADGIEYVYADDYCDLQVDFAALKRDYDELVKKLGELYRDA